MKTNRTRGKNL